MARHLIPLSIATAALAVVGLAGTAAADPEPVAAPPAANCQVIDFDSARVSTSPTMPAQHMLVVRGEKPYSNMEVKLNPLTYIQQPDYWGIEVVGCLSDMGLPALADYAVKLDLDGTMGTRGIEIIGANRAEKIDLPGTPYRFRGIAARLQNPRQQGVR